MGLLDDAIREHLELKRRRGADPTEMERLEREALGPARRGPGDAADLPTAGGETSPASADHAADWPEAGAQGLEPAAEAAPPLTDLTSEQDVAAGGAALFDHEVNPQEPSTGPSRAEPPSAEASSPVQAPAPASEAPATERAAPEPHNHDGLDRLSQETAEYDVEAEHRIEHAPTEEHHPPTQPAEDVLEETPEFLQDTPDHDRLWFEQRPPRDFDFDE